MKKIPLTKGRVALVDDDDFEYLSQWKWHVTSHGYAKSGREYMHRKIMNPAGNSQVDHINFDKLDNRRPNLRVCSSRENSLHRPINKNNSTGHKGVHFCKQHKKFEAYIWMNRKKKSLGHFVNLKDAVIKRLEAEKVLYGEFR